MLEVINESLIGSQEFIAKIISALILIIIGTPFISFKGGIPRLNKQIINKQITVIILILTGLIVLFMFDPLADLIARELIVKLTEFTVPILFILGGIAFFEFDQKMRWNFKFYWALLLFIGFILLVLESAY